MVTQYDDKGKFFTQVISKEPVQVILQTSRNIIYGAVYVRPEARLKDEINTSREHFVAITDAKVYDHQKNLMFQSRFLLINMDHIDWIIPQEELAVE
jgi:hypothetical protein